MPQFEAHIDKQQECNEQGQTFDAINKDLLPSVTDKISAHELQIYIDVLNTFVGEI